MRLKSWLRAAVGILTLSGTVQASTLLRREVGELARESAVIARAQVVRTESRWSADGMRIFTDVELVVSETLKGDPNPGSVVVVTQPGGQVGDIAQKVSGLAAFTKGEEVLVFLEQHGAGQYLVQGAMQGKYRLERDASGKLLAQPESARDVLLLDPRTREAVAPETHAVSLKELKERIQRALEVGRRRSRP